MEAWRNVSKGGQYVHGAQPGCCEAGHRSSDGLYDGCVEEDQDSAMGSYVSGIDCTVTLVRRTPLRCAKKSSRSGWSGR